MIKNLRKKLKESIFAVLPITIIVLIINFAFLRLEWSLIILFLSGAFLLIIGMSLFALGSDMAMIPMGESMSAKLSETNKLWIIIPVFFLMGFIITIAEPDLQVLADQVYAVPNTVLIVSIAVGVGTVLVLFVMKIFFKIKMKYILLFSYALIFILSIFVNKDFLAVAFDSGGVATGPIIVPFAMALGIGLATVRSGKTSNEDSFGMVALCVVGPVLAIMILGLFYNPQSHVDMGFVPEIDDFSGVVKEYLKAFPTYFMQVGIALLPILLCFVVFQIVLLKFPKVSIIRIIIGVIYTHLGLTIFLTGVNVGFLTAGKLIGGMLAAKSYNWILVPIGMVIGAVVVLAEPTVHILTNQVEEITGGALSRKAMIVALTVGVAFSVGISMLRVLTGISLLYFLIPGYALALTLSFFVPPIFTPVAFDSGGVASGPISVTFVLPLAVGASLALGGDILRDAFGAVALTTMAPPVTVQLFGLVYKLKLAKVSLRQEEKEYTQGAEPMDTGKEPVDIDTEYVDIDVVEE